MKRSSYRGFVKYTKTTNTNYDGEVESTTTKPNNNLSNKAFKNIIKSVPRIEDKIEK